MTIKIWLPMRTLTFVTAMSLALGCGKKKSKDDDGDEPPANPEDADFLVPDYGAESEPDDTYAADVAALGPDVEKLQTIGANLARIAASQGVLVLDDDSVVQLTEMARNACPADLTGCTETDSATLGVGTGALVAPFASLKDSVRKQGDRGTCLAFSLSSAVEILLARGGSELDLSEQNTYFIAKRVTDTWTSAGLEPVSTLKGLIDADEDFVAEDSWPYNNKDKACDDYAVEHPDATCSETEAQGGGADGREQDPAAVAAPVARIAKGHQLYASLGRIKQALYRGYPVVMGINANLDFSAATKKRGVVSWIFKQADCGESICGHAVLAVGYQDDPAIEGGGFVLLKNSWGSGWGEDGLAYVTYEWLANSLLDAQAVVAVE